MEDAEPEVSLPEKDYLAILDTVLALHCCRTRQALNTSVEEKLLPLVGAQNATLTMQDFNTSRDKVLQFNFIELVGMPEEDHDAVKKNFSYHTYVSQKHTQIVRPVVASHVDIPIERFQIAIDAFFADHPEFKKHSDHTLPLTTGFMCSFERPDYKVGTGIHRELPCGEPFTLREIRILELLQPHLFQAIKTVALSGLLKKYQALTETLAATPEPVALASPDHRLLFCNSAFQVLFSLQRGHFLPEELGEMIQKEASRESLLPGSPTSAKKLHFINHSQGVFRVETVPLNEEENSEDKCWFLRLKPAVETYTKLILLLQGADLSEREMEVAAFIRDGMQDPEIAARMFISLNTVRNHVKGLHKKLKVSSRGQLVALLNQ